MAAYTWLERRRIHRRAKAKLNIKQDPQDKFDFLSQCIDALTGDGTAADENEAEMICNLLYEEQAGEWGDEF